MDVLNNDKHQDAAITLVLHTNSKRGDKRLKICTEVYFKETASYKQNICKQREATVASNEIEKRIHDIECATGSLKMVSHTNVERPIYS